MIIRLIKRNIWVQNDGRTSYGVDVYRYDEHFEQNEQLWNKLKATILGEDDDEDDEDDDDEDDDEDDEDDDEEEVQCMKDQVVIKNRFGGCRC